jgi:hypothetical protein
MRPLRQKSSRFLSRDALEASQSRGLFSRLRTISAAWLMIPCIERPFPPCGSSAIPIARIATTKRGKRIATSVDGSLTGLGGNLIIDDPLKLGDAMPEAVRGGGPQLR